MKLHTSDENFPARSHYHTVFIARSNKKKPEWTYHQATVQTFSLIFFTLPLKNWQPRHFKRNSHFSFCTNVPLFLFLPAVPPCRRPCDAGRCGYLVVQRPDRGQHKPGGHPRPLPGLAPTEPAAVEQARQCTVYHVRPTAQRGHFRIPWCVLQCFSRRINASPSLHSEVWILMAPLSAWPTPTQCAPPTRELWMR